MSNVLDIEKQHKIRALGTLGRALRTIEAATGVRRETISAYLKAAGIPVRRRGRTAARLAAKSGYHGGAVHRPGVGKSGHRAAGVHRPAADAITADQRLRALS